MQFWFAPPQLPLQEQQEGPTPADMLVGALLPSALLEQLPCPVQVAPASAFHSVMALHADVSYAYVPAPITVSVARLLPPPPVHTQLFKKELMTLAPGRDGVGRLDGGGGSGGL